VESQVVAAKRADRANIPPGVSPDFVSHRAYERLQRINSSRCCGLSGIGLRHTKHGTAPSAAHLAAPVLVAVVSACSCPLAHRNLRSDRGGFRDGVILPSR